MLTVREYTEEFYKVNLRDGYVEELAKNDDRYVNGLMMDIQEDISMISPRTMDEAYQCTLRAEEKIERKQSFNRGRGSARGRGKATGRGIFVPQRGEYNNSIQREKHGRGGDSSRIGPYQGGRGRGRGREVVVRCYQCNQLGNKAFECPRKEDIGKGGAYVA